MILKLPQRTGCNNRIKEVSVLSGIVVKKHVFLNLVEKKVRLKWKKEI